MKTRPAQYKRDVPRRYRRQGFKRGAARAAPQVESYTQRSSILTSQAHVSPFAGWRTEESAGWASNLA